MRPLTPLVSALLLPVALAATPVPTFTNASVHDPSIVAAGGNYYVFGSHLASAWSEDLMHWHQYSSGATDGNPLFPNVQEDLAAVFTWSSTNTLWAPDVHLLGNGEWGFYYCASQADAPKASLGLAYSSAILGPYEDQGILIQSGMSGTSPAGGLYNATVMPNAVDPALFEDTTGKLWMTYGSYSGGIFILQMDPQTGAILPGQGYGTHITGGYHARIEGSYVVYNADTGYYYMFLSFGGLAADDGYNIRVCRSTSPTGPYRDALGQDMANARGTPSAILAAADPLIAPYGVKLMGNWQFLTAAGEPYTTSVGYKSPGHNSVLHDPATGKWFNIFHTRFVGRGEQHEIRVHLMFFNEDGWPVVLPHRYAGETIGTYTAADLAGEFKIINHGKDITGTVKTSTRITLNANGTLSGATGTWTLSGGHMMHLTLAGVEYHGVFCRAWDDDNKLWVYAFTALSPDGTALWGSHVAIPQRAQPYTAPDLAAVPAQALRVGETLQVQMDDRQSSTQYVWEYALADAPDGASIDAQTGELSFTPLLGAMGQTYTFDVTAHDALEPSITAQIPVSVYVGKTRQVMGTSVTFATQPATGIKDATGKATGLTSRLPGTGTSIGTNDGKLTLDLANSVLNLRTSQGDFNGQAGMAVTSAPGLRLSAYGFTGGQDFSIRAKFAPISNLADIDQVGLYVGTSSSTLTRAGAIVFGTTAQAYSAHTQGGSDVGGDFQKAVDPTQGLDIAISRQGGVWSYSVNGVSTHPTTGEATFLDAASDLYLGVFAITPLNANVKTAPLVSLSVQVAGGAATDTPWAQWVTAHFGANPPADVATADPDGDNRPNLLEYAVGSSPSTPDSGAPINVGWTQGHLEVSFTSLADSSLTYTLETSPDGSTWTARWSRSGPANVAGTTTLEDPFTVPDGPFQVRLRVRSADAAEDVASASAAVGVHPGAGSWLADDPQAHWYGDYIWATGYGWAYVGYWPWVYYFTGEGYWFWTDGQSTSQDSWMYSTAYGWCWTSSAAWPWVWSESAAWITLDPPPTIAQ